MRRDDTKGQAHTLEGIAAAILVLASVVFALQVTAVTPLTASTASQHIENQQQGVANGMLATARETGALRATILYWNTSELTFHEAPEETYYQQGGPPNRFGSLLNQTFKEAGIAFNVDLRYLSQAGEERQRRMVYRGHPSNHAVTVSRAITLYDDDKIKDAAGDPTGTTIGETDRFFMPDVDPNSHVYNVVRVEVTVWRM